MRRFQVSANLFRVCNVYNVDCSKDAIIEAQTHVFEHKPSLWAKLQDAEWLATDDLPPIDETKAIVEFLLP